MLRTRGTARFGALPAADFGLGRRTAAELDTATEAPTVDGPAGEVGAEIAAELARCEVGTEPFVVRVASQPLAATFKNDRTPARLTVTSLLCMTGKWRMREVGSGEEVGRGKVGTDTRNIKIQTVNKMSCFSRPFAAADHGVLITVSMFMFNFARPSSVGKYRDSEVCVPFRLTAEAAPFPSLIYDIHTYASQPSKSALI